MPLKMTLVLNPTTGGVEKYPTCNVCSLSTFLVGADIPFLCESPLDDTCLDEDGEENDDGPEVICYRCACWGAAIAFPFTHERGLVN
jgi:hypothetical protein